MIEISKFETLFILRGVNLNQQSFPRKLKLSKEFEVDWFEVTVA